MSQLLCKMTNLLAVPVLPAVHTAACPLHDQLQAHQLTHKLVLRSCYCRRTRLAAAVISLCIHAVAQCVEQRQMMTISARTYRKKAQKLAV
jgi:hypothetical protein